MSRLVMLLEERAAPGARAADGGSLRALLEDLVARLDAPAGRIELAFPYFVRKTAPVSGVASMLDYEVRLDRRAARRRITQTIAVAVPVTSLCPCSKEIADYGAHNQRSTITITVRHAADVGHELLRIAEEEASSELYGILKRADEKYVTERAYDNPRFVEDLVRGVAGEARGRPALRRLERRSRELRVDPQPLGVRAHRAGHVGRRPSRPASPVAQSRRCRPALQPSRAGSHGTSHARDPPTVPRLDVTRADTCVPQVPLRRVRAARPVLAVGDRARATCARSTRGSTGAAGGLADRRRGPATTLIAWIASDCRGTCRSRKRRSCSTSSC